MSRKKKRAVAAKQPLTGWLWLPAVVLLLIGLASSIYLLYLYIAVHSAEGPVVESFCAVSDVFNCVTVANSTYSAFLGVPIALYGVEFFSLALLGTLLSRFGIWRVRRWDSLLFWATGLALPICGLLAWISAYRIRSFCLMCTTIYAVTALLFFLFGVASRQDLRALLLDGPRELARSLRRPLSGAGLTALILLGLSQLLWVPGVFLPRSTHTELDEAWKSLPSSGLTIGPASAPFKIEEFTDFQCPHCSKAHGLMMRILQRFPGKVQLIHRDFPLDMRCNPIITRSFHPYACLAAYYARCISQQGKYWPFEALLFRNQHQLDEPSLRSFAQLLGADLEQLQRCAARPETAQAVQTDIQNGLSRGMTGTPTYFVNGEKVVGIRPMEFWEAKLLGRNEGP